MTKCCVICGSEDGEKLKRVPYVGLMCPPCRRDTPKKISREEFNRRYWDHGTEDVPLSTQREFYEDYARSTYTFEEYLLETTGRTEGDQS